MYVSMEMQKFEISVEDFSSNYDITIPVLNLFTFDTEEYYLHVNYNVNDVRTWKTFIKITVSFVALRL